MLRLAEHSMSVLEQAMHSLIQGVIVLDPSHKIQFINDPAKRFLPFTTGDIQGSLVWEVIADKDISTIVKDTLQSESNLLHREITLGHRGATRTLSFDITPLVEAKRIVGSIIMCTDITEQKMQHVRLRRAESLASLTTMVAGVAHEIKNPLGAMGIYVQLMKRELETKGSLSDDPGLSYVSVLEDELSRLNKTVVDFLFAVRPITLELETVDPQEVCEEVLNFLQPEFEKEHIRIRKRFGKGLPSIELDVRLFKHLLLNLLQNSIAAIESPRLITITTQEKGQEYQIMVSDTGKGISPDVIDKIFEPYYTTRDTGTGLGLTMVYKIVQEHGGNISVDSSTRGTTITCSFPVPTGDVALIGSDNL